jgi:hypothetical protein
VSITHDALLLLIIIAAVATAAIVHHGRAAPVRQRLARGALALRHARVAGAEAGRAIHISVGGGAVGGPRDAAATIAGINAAERLAADAAASGVPIIASSGDAIAHLSLIGVIARAQRAGTIGAMRPPRVRLLAQHDQVAYALAIDDCCEHGTPGISQTVGHFDGEYLFASEAYHRRQIDQFAASPTLASAPWSMLAADGALVGEDAHAAAAHISDAIAPQARLATHDLVRLAVIVVIVVLTALSAVGAAVPR